MEPQAQAPVTTQAQEPVQEQSIHERLTNWVKNEPDNDPHAGTELEAPKRKPEQQEEPQQAAPEEPQPEESVPEERIEIDEEAPIFDLEYKTETGKEIKKLSLKELREGFLAKQDYHRNIQKVAAERQQVAELAKQAEVKVAQQTAQQLETYKQAVLKLAAPELLNVDLNKLAMEDPAEAQRIFFKQIQLNQTLQQIDQAQRQAQEKIESSQKEALSAAIQKASEELPKAIPGWNDELYRTLLKTGVEDYGFSQQEVNNVVDPRTFKLLHDAYQYRKLQQAKPGIEKRVVAVPKVVKPGNAQKPVEDKAQEARSRLRKTGKLNDAAEAILRRGI